jgi:PIN domain nuclease of toxin-antitoxin system
MIWQWLAAVGNEPDADLVASLLPDSTITALNLTEVVKRLRERGRQRTKLPRLCRISRSLSNPARAARSRRWNWANLRLRDGRSDCRWGILFV